MLSQGLVAALAATVFSNESDRAETQGQSKGARTRIEGPLRYRAPEGFGQHRWNDGLTQFAILAPEPRSVSIAYSPGKVTFIDMQCAPSATGGCDLEKSLRTLHQKVEAEGYHALAEYQSEGQGFRFSTSGVTLYPISWMFCAKWGGFTGAVPQDIQHRLKLCGIRALFRSQTADELTALPADFNSAYDTVLGSLIAMYGPPDRYHARPRISIESEDGRIGSPTQLAVSEWRWCGVRGNDLAPQCAASIVLALDAATGWGTLLYVTRPVWEFAYARHQGGAPNNALYQLLHGLDRRHAVDERCTGTHLCRPDPPRPMSPATRAQSRLKTPAGE